MSVLGRIAEPAVMARFHAYATAAWFAMMPVAALTGLRESVPFLVFVSVYALAVGHFSSWQAARAECRIADGETPDTC